MQTIIIQLIPRLAQNPKLSNSELASGSSKTLGGGLCPPDFISKEGNFGIGRSATTRDERRRSIARGSGASRFLNAGGAGRRNSQFRTSTCQLYVKMIRQRGRT